MKMFTKNELLGVITILALIVGASLYNFNISLRRSRDAQRKVDLGVLINGVSAFHTDFGFYPPSLDGKIVACKKEGVDYEKISQQLKVIDKKELNLFEVYAPCEWGKDSLADIFDPDYPAYIETLPMDPHASDGAYYTYLSNPNRVQIYAGLEGKDEDSAQPIIAERDLSCGIRVCDFGRSSGATPLEKSIEEYENELLQTK